MYELHTIHPWHGSKSRSYETLQEVVEVLENEHFAFKWDYSKGREVLHEGLDGTLAQVFHDGCEITRTLCPNNRNLLVLY